MTIILVDNIMLAHILIVQYTRRVKEKKLKSHCYYILLLSAYYINIYIYIYILQVGRRYTCIAFDESPPPPPKIYRDRTSIIMIM